jgi:uncharacterized protein involved in exopolysaccharide biosynthesis
MIAGIWALTAVYLVAMPRTYTSQFSLILPGSGAGSSINVESIGQAQSSSNSAFSSATLSPTENYKQLLTADVTLRAAARLLHEPEDGFPTPTIKLVDQTNLINLTITARTAAKAHARADALITAFLQELDRLRADEAAKHEENDIRHVNELKEKVQAAQRRLIDFQASHGLATLEQFNARIGSVDSLREKERELRVTMLEQQGKAGRLGGTLQSAPQRANIALRLRGDPVFAELAQRYAQSNADAEQKAGTLGPNHASRAQADAERRELLNALVNRGHDITGLSAAELMRHIDIQVGDGRSQLMQAMSVEDANAAGTRDALVAVRNDLKEARTKTSGLIQQAQTLADLLREARVTDAVFSSALAHLDTTKQDPFASYPLVQVLAAPSLPAKPSSPSKPLGLAGAFGATLIILLAFGLIWIRQPILDKMLRKG